MYFFVLLWGSLWDIKEIDPAFRLCGNDEILINIIICIIYILPINNRIVYQI